MFDDHDRCYAAVRARDARFDGWFVTAVTSTGIYCRPSCPARTPVAANVRFHPTAASAQRAGFRACKRCRPDASPGSPEWDLRADLVARAMRAIADGVVDREGVPGLASRLGYSSRHLHRQLVAEVGAGPLALARAQRARTARILLETTTLPVTEVAHAAGFRSVRQFNDTTRAIFGLPPTELRRRSRHGATGVGESLILRLPFRQPADLRGALEHLATRAVTGLEETTPTSYRRALALPNGSGVVELAPQLDHVRATLHLDDLRDLTAAVQRCRRLLDLDADPRAVDEHLAGDAVLAGPVRTYPGTRVPGYPDAFEAAVRTVLGQQISVAAARRQWQRLVEHFGTPLRTPVGTIVRGFPSPEILAASDLALIGGPRSRQRALAELAQRVADGSLDLGAAADRDQVRAALLAIRGIGPWTAEEVALRGLGDPDAFPSTDLVLRQQADRLGLPGNATELAAVAERWRPWRAYAAQHLWRVAVPAAAA